MVAEKLLKIMEAVGYIMKDGKIDMGSKGKFTVLTERKVLQMLRPHFVKQKLIILPAEVTHLERSGSITTLAMKYKIIDIEDADSEIVASVGQGSSTGDKGVGSAFTYSLKYLLLKSTMQESGDDPDLVGDDVHDEETDKLTAKAVALAQEVSLLIKGKMITPEVGTGLINALKEHTSDDLYLKNAEASIIKMKEKVGG
jgi:hypothetical protein